MHKVSGNCNQGIVSSVGYFPSIFKNKNEKWLEQNLIQIPRRLQYELKFEKKNPNLIQTYVTHIWKKQDNKFGIKNNRQTFII